jgi:hypothetical protein
LGSLVEKDVEIFSAEDFVNSLLIVEAINADQGAIGVPDFKVAFKQPKVTASPEHFDKAVRPEALGGSDPRPARHQDSRTGIGGGLDTKPSKDYVCFAGACAAVE